MRRILRGLGSLSLLLGALCVMPWLLWHVGARLLPRHITRTGITRLFVTPDSTGAVLVWLITLVCWICWAIFAICLLVELVNLASGHRLHLQLPGLAGPQRLVAGMLLAVVALVSTPLGTSLAAAAPAPTTVSATTSARPTGTPTAAPSQSPTSQAPSSQAPVTPQAPTPQGSRPAPAQAPAPAGHWHTVTSGQTLWSLAQHYYGDGSAYTRIAQANHLEASTILTVGQKLLIPGVGGADGGRTFITVAEGDTLSSLAEEYLGHADHWEDLWRANHQVIGEDPNELNVGVRLTLPTSSAPRTPSTTHPGSAAHPAPTTPSTRTDRPATPSPTPHTTTPPAPPSGSGHTRAVPGATPTTVPSTAKPSVGGSSGAVLPGSRPVGSAPANTQNGAPAVAHSAHQERNVGVLGAIGLLLTAGLVTSINQRRRRQLHDRVRGQRLVAPSESAQRTETTLRARGEVLTITHLDAVLRAIAAHCLATGTDLPVLSAARVADDRIDLLLAQPSFNAPEGVDMIAEGSVWTVHLDRIDQLLAQPNCDRVAPPYPTLVTLGRDDSDAHILIDLETAAALTITSSDPDEATAAITGIALELSMAPWSADVNLTLVGDICPDLDTALQAPTVTRVHDVDDLLRSLTERADVQRELLQDSSVGHHRIDPDTADGWCPELILLQTGLTADQADQFAAILTRLPRVAIAAVTTAAPAMTEWTFTLADGTGRLQPHDWRIAPQLVDEAVYRDMLELLTTSATPETTDAPWWDHDQPAASHILPESGPEHTDAIEANGEDPNAGEGERTDAPATITHLDVVRAPLSLDRILTPAVAPIEEGPKEATSTGGSSLVQLRSEESFGEHEVDVDAISAPAVVDPMLRIMGPVDLVGARGEQNRSPRRCQELLLYIHLHPGQSAQAISEAVCTSRTTVKSTLTYLRRWLGSDDHGIAYLDAGGNDGYRLDRRITTDWDQVQQLVSGKVQHTSTPHLVQALKLVRGVPFAGARGEFSWTESEMLGIHITSLITDIALVLTDRALEARDIRLARWAATTALQADPQSEALLTARARTEYVAGNIAEVTRLVDRIQHNARAIGMDLCDDTITILESIEVAG